VAPKDDMRAEELKGVIGEVAGLLAEVHGKLTALRENWQHLKTTRCESADNGSRWCRVHLGELSNTLREIRSREAQYRLLRDRLELELSCWDVNRYYSHAMGQPYDDDDCSSSADSELLKAIDVLAAEPFYNRLVGVFAPDDAAGPIILSSSRDAGRVEESTTQLPADLDQELLADTIIADRNFRIEAFTHPRAHIQQLFHREDPLGNQPWSTAFEDLDMANLSAQLGGPVKNPFLDPDPPGSGPYDSKDQSPSE
jgi:hypothetical protein